MVLEVAILNVRQELSSNFEADFKKAGQFIQSIDGYISHSLKKSVENSNQYLLQVYWKSIEDHKIGFRTSESYIQWKDLLHDYYHPFPEVNYYQDVL